MGIILDSERILLSNRNPVHLTKLKDLSEHASETLLGQIPIDLYPLINYYCKQTIGVIKDTPYQYLFSYECTDLQKPQTAWGTAISPMDGNVFVAEHSSHSISVYNQKGKFLYNFPFDPSTTNTEDGTELYPGFNNQYPIGMAFDDKGDLHVAGFGAQTIRVFNPSDGKILRSYGTNGKENGQLAQPYDICFDNVGNCLVADSGNKRIQVPFSLSLPPKNPFSADPPGFFSAFPGC